MVIFVVGNCVVDAAVCKSVVKCGILVLVGNRVEEVFDNSVVIFVVGNCEVDVFDVGSCVVDAVVCKCVVEDGIWVVVGNGVEEGNWQFCG